MTDLLAERFARLADPTDDSDWHDVRRRAGREHRRYAIPIAAAVATIAVAAALAAGGGWLFTNGFGGNVQGTTQVEFHGNTYASQTLMAKGGRFFCILLLPHRAASWATDLNDFVARGCGASVLTVKDLPQQLVPPSTPTGPAFGALRFDQSPGQIWFGDTRPTIHSIVITDTQGHAFRTRTAAPPTMKTAFRVWIVALPSSTAQTIAGYDEHGTLVQRRSIYGLGDFDLH
jgi:hypothetical protein